LNISEIATTTAAKIATLLQGDLAVVLIIAFVLFNLFLLLSMALLIRSVIKRGKLSREYEQSLAGSQQQLMLLRQQFDSQSNELKKSHIQLQSLEILPAELAASNAKLEQLRERLQKQELLTDEQRSARDRFEHSLHQLKVDSSQKETRLLTEQKAMEEKLELLRNTEKQLGEKFENIANKIFEEKNEHFSKNSKQLLDYTLSPLKNQLESFRKRVDDVYNNEAKERHLLKGEIEKLRADSLRISEDASNLTSALKHDNKAQGNWGELSLKSVLEMCGLSEGIEFETQTVVQQEGSRFIPDVVVHLPGGKDIVVDSKVSLLAYTRYFEADDENDQKVFLREHIQSVRGHVKDLSGKNYSNLESLNTLDYVMLYIPIEGASSLALQNDLELWNFAYNKNIILVGPSNLLAILRSVETIWRHERQNKNAERIAAEAGKLHDQFVLFAESLTDVGKQIDKARTAYDKANERLLSGRGNVLRRVENLEKLGAKVQRQIPESLKSAADMPDGITSDMVNDRASDTANDNALVDLGSKTAATKRIENSVDEFETE